MTVTCPFCMEIFTSADALAAAKRQTAVQRIAVFMVRFQYTRPLLLPEVVNHLSQDFVQLQLGLVTDEPLDPREVRPAARHVLEPGFIRFVVGDQLDRRRRAAELTDALGEL